MTMALIAQAAIGGLRKRLANPTANWDAKHMASAYFKGLEGDLRVDGNTILVTSYKAPGADTLRARTTSTCRPSSSERKSPRAFPGSTGLNSIFASDDVK
jgi:hypothetical protein